MPLPEPRPRWRASRWTPKCATPLGPSLGQCCGGVVWPTALNTFAEPPRVAHAGSPLRWWARGPGAGPRLTALPFDLHWIDSREGVFPPGIAGQHEHADPVQDAVPDLAAGSHVVIMSFSHAEDLDILAAVLLRQRQRGDLPFIGPIGSRTTGGRAFGTGWRSAASRQPNWPRCIAPSAGRGCRASGRSRSRWRSLPSCCQRHPWRVTCLHLRHRWTDTTPPWTPPTCSTGPTCCCAGCTSSPSSPWIRASFYFVWLDNHLTKPPGRGTQRPRAWMASSGPCTAAVSQPAEVHARPGALPKDLHWFYWESYWTWMSGFALFVVLYLPMPARCWWTRASTPGARPGGRCAGAGLPGRGLSKCSMTRPAASLARRVTVPCSRPGRHRGPWRPCWRVSSLPGARAFVVVAAMIAT